MLMTSAEKEITTTKFGYFEPNKKIGKIDVVDMQTNQTLQSYFIPKADHLNYGLENKTLRAKVDLIFLRLKCKYYNRTLI
jgi:hypothetical protein